MGGYLVIAMAENGKRHDRKPKNGGKIVCRHCLAEMRKRGENVRVLHYGLTQINESGKCEHCLSIGNKELFEIGNY